jgi:hypothetical protein
MVNMSEDNIYKYLGLGLVSILAIYIGVKSLSFQAKLIEGMTNNSDKVTLLENTTNISDEKIKQENEKSNDILSINKHRTNYENLIIALEEYTNIMMFNYVTLIGNQINQKKSGVELIPIMQQANTAKSFIDTLNASMKFIDRKK